MSPELYLRLLESGARDAWIPPQVMQKGRPGMLISVLCEGRDENTMTRLLFAETTTPGVRRSLVSRTALQRTQHSVQTPYDPVLVKVAQLPNGSRRAKLEYEACRNVALQRSIPLCEFYGALERLLEEKKNGK